MQRRDYDIFERLSDNSTIWRATVRGRFEAERRMQEFSEHSENVFFSIDNQAESADDTIFAALHDSDEDSDEGERQEDEQLQQNVRQLRSSRR
jgi:hypothetical protein